MSGASHNLKERNNTNVVVNREEIKHPVIIFGLIAAFLTAFNTIIANLALGVFQGPIVAFTTPFVFCLGRLIYPKLPAATFIYIPVVAVAIFTLNLGPPGVYKILYIIGAILYDLVCYVFGVGFRDHDKVALWKLWIAIIFYPVGLLLGALLAMQFITTEIPLLSRSYVGALMIIAVFVVIGGFATWICHRVFYKWIRSEIDF